MLEVSYYSVKLIFTIISYYYTKISSWVTIAVTRFYLIIFDFIAVTVWQMMKKIMELLVSDKYV